MIHICVLQICFMGYSASSLLNLSKSINIILFRYIVPVKEQCGVKDPYLPEYGHLQDCNH